MNMCWSPFWRSVCFLAHILLLTLPRFAAAWASHSRHSLRSTQYWHWTRLQRSYEVKLGTVIYGRVFFLRQKFRLIAQTIYIEYFSLTLGGRWWWTKDRSRLQKLALRRNFSNWSPQQTRIRRIFLVGGRESWGWWWCFGFRRPFERFLWKLCLWDQFRRRSHLVFLI